LDAIIGFFGLAACALLPVAAQAQDVATSLSVGGADPYTARYSQALAIEARLEDADGQGVAGQRLEFFLAHGDDPEFLFGEAFTDSTGEATARLALVDGNYGGQTFLAAAATPESDGEPYALRVAFAGALVSVEPPVPDGGLQNQDGGMAPDAGPPLQVNLLASSGEADLFVALENSFLDLAPGNEANLGETLTLVATLTDENGNAPASGTGTDGSSALGIGDRTIGFFHDKNGNGRPENTGGEFLGTATTNSDGVASFSFTADPADNVRAGDFDNGLHVQFSGDDRYRLAGDSSRLVIHPGLPDGNKTILEVEPSELEADGFSEAVITATLVDAFNNPLTLDSEPETVVFEITSGKLLETVKRNPTTGLYEQTVRAPTEGGTATITATLEGRAGKAETTITFLARPGCSCHGSGSNNPADSSTATGLGLLAFALFGVHLGTRRPRGTFGGHS
jgi:hypothetical protein